MRVAAAATGPDRDGWNAVVDRDVCVGGRQSEIGLSADETRRFESRLHQSMIGRRLATWARAD